MIFVRARCVLGAATRRLQIVCAPLEGLITRDANGDVITLSIPLDDVNNLNEHEIKLIRDQNDSLIRLSRQKR